MRPRFAILFIASVCVFQVALHQWACRPTATIRRRAAALNRFAVECLPLRKAPEPQLQNGSHRVIIGVMSSSAQLLSLGKAAVQTWIKKSTYAVYFFIGTESAGTVPMLDYPYVVQFDCPAMYPPRSQVFGLWRYLYRYVDEFEWFLQIDSDTFVNVAALEKLIAALPQNSSKPIFVGKQALGRKGEDLGMAGLPYCLGMGYVINRSLLTSVGPHLLSCLRMPFSNHSDTEISRCFSMHSDVTCQESPLPLKQLYSSVVAGTVFPRALSAEQQMSVTFPDVPTQAMFEAPLMHPLKSAASFHQFQQQLDSYVRPVFPELHVTGAEGVSTHEVKSARLEISSSCVHNPSVQFQIAGAFLSECESPKPSARIDVVDLPVFVLNLPGEEARYREVQRHFAVHGFVVKRFVASRGQPLGDLTGGEVGYVKSMEGILKQAIREKYPRLLVLDDDARPRRDFRAGLTTLLNCSRCGGFQWSESRGGVLLLGASVWTNGSYPRDRSGGWRLIDADVQRNGRDCPLCYNANNKTYGSFAVLYHRNAFEPLLHLMQTRPDLRFDWLWYELGRLGYIVRVAHPPLIIQDVAHQSQVNSARKAQTDLLHRARIHRWPIDQFYMNDSTPLYTSALN